MQQAAKRLILVRHAKAQMSAPSDFERVLTESGEQEAARAARRLRERGIRPERILTSSASRARATAEAFLAAADLAPTALQALPELYLAEPPVLLQAVARWGGEAASLMVVAHNPGISALARQLSGEGLGELPTAAVVELEWPEAGWEVAPGCPARLRYLDHPLTGLLRGE